MNIYQLVSDTCNQADVSDLSTVHRLVGTLRSAGFTDELSDSQCTTAVQILQARILPKRMAVTAAVEEADVHTDEPLSPKAKFEEIEALRGKNLCPRCKREMNEVKLSDYRKSKYCRSCKVALWAD